ncbi:MAG: metallophosphoesterase family protein [Thermoproteota archaeon]
MGITLKCSTCPLAPACVKSGRFTPPEIDAYYKLSLMLESWSRSPPDIALPHLIPEIPLESPVKPRKDLGMDGVIVSISKVDSVNVRRVESEGIHNFLDFDGPVLLLTIMPDRLLTDETFNFTVNFVMKGGFDGVVGWDVPVYADHPKALNLSNLIKATLLTMRYVEEGIPTIPLLKGGDSSEIAFHGEWLRKLGFRRIGLHATEYVLARGRRGTEAHGDIAKIADDLYSLGLLKIYEIGAKPLIVGTLGLKGLRDFYKSDPEISLAGMSWLIEAMNWRAYAGTPSGMSIINLGRDLMECSCRACLGKSPNQIAESSDDIAEHNWVLLKEYAEKGELREVSVYDMILEKDDRLAVVGDLHIGVPQSLWLPCLRRLQKAHPTHLVLLGDVFDFVRGVPRASQITGFLSLVKSLGVHMRYVSGCSDSNVPKFLKTLMKFAFAKGLWEPQLYSPRPMLVEAMRALTMLRRFSKSRIRVKLANEKIVTLSHGHELSFRADANLEEVMRKLLENKGPEEIRVIGHYHRSLYRPEEGGVMLGTWLAMTPEDRKMGISPDVGDMLVIGGDGSMELLKGV